ncbi:MAG TPA: hypothetical protein VFS39_16555 [Nitrospira sp.]|nr:hypothetical protein [Nitrospira sp.]
MAKTVSRVLLILLTLLLTEHLAGIPLPPQDPMQSDADAQAEVDGGEEGGEPDCTAAPRWQLESILRMQVRSQDSISCPQDTFASDFFHPPTRLTA